MATPPNTEANATPANTATKPAAAQAAPKVTRKRAPASPKPKAPVAGRSTTKTVAKPALEKPVKQKKPKLVRDSFTIPKTEYAVLDELKLRAVKLGTSIKKSELIRAGIKALAAMDDTALLSALGAVPAIKTGRPAKAKAKTD